MFPVASSLALSSTSDPRATATATATPSSTPGPGPGPALLDPSSSQESIVADLRRLLARSPAAANPKGRERPERMSTGWTALDQALGGGFLRGALNEIAGLRAGSGLLEAFLPAFMTERAELGRPPRFWAWVGLEEPPYPPALLQMGFPLDRWLIIRPRRRDEQFWAMEQIMRSGLCAALVSPIQGGSRRGLDPALRRLQLAAREGDCTALLLRSPEDLRHSSPAPLRLLARPRPGPGRRRRLVIEILKTRGRADARPVLLEWNHDALDEPAFSRTCPGEPDASTTSGAERPARALPA